MLVTMKEIVEAARKGGYCVPAPNYANELDMAKCIEAAEELRSPLILDIGHRGDLDSFISLAAASRERAIRATVPVCINLDHGSKWEYIVQAIHYGCTSVMIDRSSYPYAENAAMTAEMVKIAHACGVSVEAEIGHVGQNVQQDGQGNANSLSDLEAADAGKRDFSTEEQKRKFYTNPEEAVKFVEETGVDCLAVAVGTVHGLYPAGFTPSIDFDLLKELSEKVSVPLVIHGGSGTPEHMMARFGEFGVGKMNVASDIFKAKAIALNEAVKNGSKDPVGEAENAYKEELKRFMRVLGSAGKAA